MVRKSTRQFATTLILTLWAVGGVILAACTATSIEDVAVPTDVGTTEAPPAQSTPIPPTDTPVQPELADSPIPTDPASTSGEGRFRLVLAPEGNEARYRVREQLANLSFPSDAVGATSDISGMIVVKADGDLLQEESIIQVNLTTLRSDSERRDGYIQRNTLQTGSFPTAEFVPGEAPGLPTPLPSSGEVTFQLAGDLTLHGVTRPVVWDVTAQVLDVELVGQATTNFTFSDFGMSVPRVASVLSVEETIRLEYEFHFLIEQAG